MDIDTHLVSALVRQQFPEFRDLPIEPVSQQGWDNRTFRLGDSLSVRLPSHVSYASAVAKEAHVLGALGNHVSFEVPEVIALGEPCKDYPLPWSIRRWVEGETLESTVVVDQNRFAKSLGKSLVELRHVPAADGPYAGKHSFFRGCHPSAYGDEFQECLNRLKGDLDTEKCQYIWHVGIASVWTEAPAWFHGDVAAGNLIVADSTVKAFIDFGLCGVGDPACDFVMAWTYFDAEARQSFREASAVDEETWHRARAWALWKALVCLSGLSRPDMDGRQARALRAILEEDC